VIFISSSCIKSEDKIVDTILALFKNGIKNIELSGGTKYYENILEDLLNLKKDYNINFQLHNYFPPPQQDFVLNLGSLNDKIYNQTLDHFKKSIEISEALGSTRFALHAGFLIDPNVKELGKKISSSTMYDRNRVLNRFCKGYSQLLRYTDNVSIYIENNVFSYKNSLNFEKNPFLFTSYESYLELNEIIDFKILLDLAHLKVSANTLNLNFYDEAGKLICLTDYLHLSDNDGKSDSNKPFKSNSDILKVLKNQNLSNKILTLEVYDNLTKVLKSQELLKIIMSPNSEA
tara:strand:+ start:42 stop:908 length:867 start_codon:yes stop_codon:yes gene_type:complete